MTHTQENAAFRAVLRKAAGRGSPKVSSGRRYAKRYRLDLTRARALIMRLLTELEQALDRPSAGEQEPPWWMEKESAVSALSKLVPLLLKIVEEEHALDESASGRAQHKSVSPHDLDILERYVQRRIGAAKGETWEDHV